MLVLPLAERVRCALISKRWAALLAEPPFYAELSFEGVRRGAVTAETLLTLVRRSRGQLRSLDLTSEASGFPRILQTGHPPLAVLEALAAEGLTGRLERLGLSTFLILGAETARRLRAACPALQRAELRCGGPWRDAFAAAAAAAFDLPGGDGVDVLTHFRYENAIPVDLAAAAVAALARTRVRGLFVNINPGAKLPQAAPAEPADDAVAAAAIGCLGAALCDPRRGVQEFRESSFSPDNPWVVAPAVLRALSAESPLRVLELTSRPAQPESLQLLAAALAPGRSRLEVPELGGVDFSTEDGCGTRPPGVPK